MVVVVVQSAAEESASNKDPLQFRSNGSDDGERIVGRLRLDMLIEKLRTWFGSHF